MRTALAFNILYRESESNLGAINALVAASDRDQARQRFQAERPEAVIMEVTEENKYVYFPA